MSYRRLLPARESTIKAGIVSHEKFLKRGGGEMWETKCEMRCGKETSESENASKARVKPDHASLIRNVDT